MHHWGDKPIRRTDFLAALPSEWPEDPFPEIQRHVRTADRKIVVLDDDPTGNQTVHDLGVLTCSRWNYTCVRCWTPQLAWRRPGGWLGRRTKL
jgi:hypothetical protein